MHGSGNPYGKALPQKSPLLVTPSAARGLGWWVQADSGELNPRFLVAPLLGMTVLRQGPMGTYTLHQGQMGRDHWPL